jgi:hypothetical protein
VVRKELERQGTEAGQGTKPGNAREGGLMAAWNGSRPDADEGGARAHGLKEGGEGGREELSCRVEPERRA